MADLFDLYLKTNSVHWCVLGSHFRVYGLLLDEQAKQIYSTTASIAIRIEDLGATTFRDYYLLLDEQANQIEAFTDAAAQPVKNSMRPRYLARATTRASDLGQATMPTTPCATCWSSSAKITCCWPRRFAKRNGFATSTPTSRPQVSSRFGRIRPNAGPRFCKRSEKPGCHPHPSVRSTPWR